MKPKILLSVNAKKEYYIDAVNNCGGIAVARYCPKVSTEYDGLNGTLNEGAFQKEETTQLTVKYYLIILLKCVCKYQYKIKNIPKVLI